MRRVLALACAVAPLAAFAQDNPAARGADATPRFAQLGRTSAVAEAVASVASPFSPTCGDRSGTLYINAEVEPHIAVDPLNANHLVGTWQQDRYANGGARGQVSGVSFDGGATWTRTALGLSACGGGEYARATDPWVSFAPDGTVYQIALGISGEVNQPSSVSGVLVYRSTDGGLTWSAPITVARDTGSLFNDKETITADPLDPRFVYAVWDRLLGDTSSTIFARSTDAGASWEPARAIYTPTTGTIGNLIRVLPDGTLVNAFMLVAPRGTPSIHVMRSGDRGATWSEPIQVAVAAGLGASDPETGFAIRDGAIIPQMAVGRDGVLHMVWQDSRFTQVRDAIAYSRSADGGRTWSQPVRVNSNADVAAFTPQVHVRDDGTIGVTFYDLRSNTADPATLPADYWLARSTDGVNWNETRVSAPFDLATAPIAGGYFLGDYMGLVSAGTTFIALYAKTTGSTANRTDIHAARIAQPGAADAKHALALEAALETYRAQPMPAADPGEAFWDRVRANAERALRSRYLNVQR